MRKKKTLKIKLEPAVVKKVADRAATKMDLKGYRLHDAHMAIIDLSQFQSLVWLNLPSNQLTELPIGICSLPALKTLRLSSNYLSSLPSQISALYALTSLDLAKNDFKSLGPEIGALSNLVDLNLHWNGLCNICPEMNNLAKLKTFNLSLNCLSVVSSFAGCLKIENLDLSHNRLQDIPDFFSTFTNLGSLNLAGNRLSRTTVGAVLSSLTSLTTLDMQGNELSTLPSGIGDLQSLRYLRLRGNYLTSLPDGMSNLVNLEELEISNNLLESLPDGITALTKLTALLLYQNNLTKLPDGIDKMVNIRELGLAYNAITALPASLSSLSRVTNFASQFNAVSTINPLVFSEMRDCQELYLNHNGLTSLPDTLTCLASLHKLELLANQLSELPNIDCLTLLQVLELGENAFSKFPVSVTKCASLQHLNLFSNQLSAIPDSISDLGNLKRLYLGYNNLSVLPKEFSALVHLEDLFLAGNNFTVVPAEILNLPALKLLCLGTNAISEIPAEITGLTALESLLMNNNRLTKICPELCKLENLSELDVSHNEIAELPTEFGFLKKLLDLDISGNILHGMPESFEQNCSQIKQLKIGFNNLWRVPHFTAFEKAKEQETTINQHLPFISCASNPLISAWYGPKVDEKQLQKEFLKQEKRLLKRVKKSDNSDSISSQEETQRPTSPTGSDTPPTSPDLIPESAKRRSNSSTGPSATNGPGDKLDSQTSFSYLRNIKSPKKKLRNSSIDDSSSESDLLLYRCRVGWSEIRGRRPTQEDTITICTNFRGNPDRALLCCFDGHAGEKSSELAARKVAGVLAQHLDFVEMIDEGLLDSFNQHELLFPMCPSTSTQDSQKRGLTNFEFDKSSKKDLEKLLYSLPPSPANSPQNTATLPTPTDNDLSEEKPEPEAASAAAKSTETGLTVTKVDTPRRTFVGTGYRLQGHKKKDEKKPDEKDNVDSPAEDKEPKDKEDPSGSSNSDDDNMNPSSPQLGRNVPSIITTNTTTNTTTTITVAASGDKFKSSNKAFSGAGLVPKLHPALTPKKSSPSASKQRSFLTEAEHSWVFNATLETLHRKITKRKFTDGAAALLIMVEHDNKRLVIANSGDERAVLARGKFAVPLTTDHKPDEAQEKLRIYHVGGFINESRRVDGILTLSRSVGDNYLQPHVTYCPDVCFVDLIPEDKFLIIGCDGLWDVLTNEEAVEIASRANNPTLAAAMLRDYAYFLGSQDNISVIVYQLDGAVTPEHLQLNSRKSKSNKRSIGMLSKSSPVLLTDLQEEKGGQPLTSTSGGMTLPAETGDSESDEETKRTTQQRATKEPLSSHRKRDNTPEKKNRK